MNLCAPVSNYIPKQQWVLQYPSYVINVNGIAYSFMKLVNCEYCLAFTIDGTAFLIPYIDRDPLVMVKMFDNGIQDGCPLYNRTDENISGLVPIIANPDVLTEPIFIYATYISSLTRDWTALYITIYTSFYCTTREWAFSTGIHYDAGVVWTFYWWYLDNPGTVYRWIYKIGGVQQKIFFPGTDYQPSIRPYAQGYDPNPLVNSQAGFFTGATMLDWVWLSAYYDEWYGLEGPILPQEMVDNFCVSNAWKTI